MKGNINDKLMNIEDLMGSEEKQGAQEAKILDDAYWDGKNAGYDCGYAEAIEVSNIKKYGELYRKSYDDSYLRGYKEGEQDGKNQIHEV